MRVFASLRGVGRPLVKTWTTASATVRSRGRLTTAVVAVLMTVATAGTPNAVSQTDDGAPFTFVADRGPSGFRIVQAFRGVSGSWSPDGKLIAFMRPRDEGGDLHYDLFVRSVETGVERA